MEGAVELALLFVSGVAAAAVFVFLRLPGGAILGSLIAAYLFAARESSAVAVPRAAVIAAQLAIGIIVASTFTESTLRSIRRYFPPAIMVAMLTVAIGLGIGAFLSVRLVEPAAVMLMGTIPGGASDVSAIVIDLDEGFSVAAMLQIVRQTSVFLVTGILLRHHSRTEG